MIDLIKSILRGPERRWPTAPAMSAAVVAVLMIGFFYAGAPAEAARAAAAGGQSQPVESERLADIEDRVVRVRDGLASLGEYYDDQVAPVERVLLRYRNDPELARRVAVALVREANEAGLQPRLLLGVLLVENPWLDPEIRSPVGAIGLMQVMPVHRGGWSDCGSDLEDIDSNICHGAKIFAHYFNRTGGNMDRALLRYNGCVRGTNTPDCHLYPNHVYARAGRASLLAWMGARPTAASP
jgi:soluble lytic murein transglycosylase-like protein